MRINRAVLLAMVVCVLSSASVSAQGMTGKIGVSPLAGVNMPIQYLQSDEGGGNAKLGFAIGAAGEYFVNEEISVGARFIFDRFGMDLPDGDLSGHWTMIEFGAFGRYQFMVEKPTHPFVRVGVGLGKATATVKDGIETESKIAMAPRGELAGGIIHKLQDNLSLFGELNWTALATDGKDVDRTVDGDDAGTFEAEKHLQWVGIKVGAIFFLGGKTQP